MPFVCLPWFANAPASVVAQIENVKASIYYLFSLGWGVPPNKPFPSKNKEEVSNWMQQRCAAQGRPSE
eukprot:5042075-Lingulodinium_polyedra.AAC.1